MSFRVDFLLVFFDFEEDEDSFPFLLLRCFFLLFSLSLLPLVPDDVIPPTEGTADEATEVTDIPMSERTERRRPSSMRNLSKSLSTASVLPILSLEETRALMDKKKRAISLQTPKQASQRKLDRQAAKDAIRGSSDHEISLISRGSQRLLKRHASSDGISRRSSERALMPRSRSSTSNDKSKKNNLKPSSSLRNMRSSGSGDRQRRRSSARAPALISVVEEDRQRRRSSVGGHHLTNKNKGSENKSRRNSQRGERTIGPGLGLKRNDSGSSNSSHDSLTKSEPMAPASARTILRTSSYGGNNTRSSVSKPNSVKFAPTVSVKQF